MQERHQSINSSPHAGLYDESQSLHHSLKVGRHGGAPRMSTEPGSAAAQGVAVYEERVNRRRNGSAGGGGRTCSDQDGSRYYRLKTRSAAAV